MGSKHALDTVWTTRKAARQQLPEAHSGEREQPAAIVGGAPANEEVAQVSTRFVFVHVNGDRRSASMHSNPL